MVEFAQRAFLLAAFVVTASAPLLAHAAAPVVYHSPADDGVAAGVPFPIATSGTHVLHLYIDGGATPSSAGSACEQGAGDELCAWQVAIEASGDVALESFVPDGGALYTLTSTRLRAVGGDAITGSLGSAKLGDLTVETASSGALELVAGKSIDAALTLRTLDATPLVTIPEPATGALLVATFASLAALARRRAQRALALVVLLLVAPALARAADTDADGVDDAQDNCPYWSNPGQSDAGGFDAAGPDGIGDACQCGDANDDGVADLRDVARIERALAQLGPALLAPQKCPASATGVCTAASFAALREALVDPETGLAQSCLAANPLPSCGDENLDLGEQCDDDSPANGDCCSAKCTLVSGACSDGDACTEADQCSSGVCAGTPVQDAFEPNDSPQTASDHGVISDSAQFPFTVLTPTLHSAGDVDWFRYTIDDGFGGTVAPRVDLGGIPAGHDYDLCVYYECLSGDTANLECGATTPAQNGGRNGCCSRKSDALPESVHIGVVCGDGVLNVDSGDVYVVVEHVSGAATCTPYSLSLGDD
jgi:hypothetical protein